VLCKNAPKAKRVVFETGPLSIWFNKTDANNAEGLAHLAEVGFFRDVRVKGYNSVLVRTLVAARNKLVQMSTELSN